jgi:hypothetical protein
MRILDAEVPNNWKFAVPSLIVFQIFLLYHLIHDIYVVIVNFSA